MSSKPFSGSLCLTDLINLEKEGHSAFNVAQSNGKTYVNVTLWEHDVPDKFGFTRSIQLNPRKDSQQSKDYVGNFKPVTPKE